MTQKNPRQLALEVLHRVLFQGQSLTFALQHFLTETHQHHAIVQQYAYGVMRYWHRLEGLLSILLNKPLKEKDVDIQLIVLIGCYELLYTQTADYAVISESVNVAIAIHKPWAKGLINALLRRVQREKETLNHMLDGDQVTRYSHPQWMINILQQAYPNHWETILAVNNTHAPMTLRINAMLGSRQHYWQQLAEQNIAATQTTLSPDGVILKQPQSAASLPGFHEGWVTVQDEAAQYAAVLLDCQPGMRVLDACAAPGNKASHIAAKQPCDLLAIDCDASRVESIKTLQQRLHFQADIRCADATKPALWWDQQPFDRILVDAPCSGTGVIRRHPDIKYHRRLADLDHFIQQQKDLLHALWPLLRQGGKMLYVTCSLLPQENSQQVEQFIQQHRDAQLMDSQQLIPTENSWDGLFFARIMKAIEAVY